MLLSEVMSVGAIMRPLFKTLKDKKDATKVQPVERIAKGENEPDVKKKPVSKLRIDTYA